MKKLLFWAGLPIAALVKLFLTTGHLVGPLIYMTTSSPEQIKHLHRLYAFGALPQHCTFVTANANNPTVAQYTAPESEITPDRKISLMSASKIVSAIIILSVFPQPDTVTLSQVLPTQLLHKLDDQRLNITIRELLSFTSGVDQGTCESKATGWEDCVGQLLLDHYQPQQRGSFSYSRSHLTIAGFAAVTYSNKTWTQLMQTYIIEPADIQPASKWDEPHFANGDLAFDAPVDFWELRDTALENHRERLQHHPLPSSALSGSARQMAAVYSALLGGRYGDQRFVDELLTPRVPTAFGLWSHYASGNWRGKGIAHSQGMLGTFPFIAMDVENPWIGIFVMDRRRSAVWRGIVSTARTVTTFVESLRA